MKIRSKHSYLASFLLQERDRGQNSEWFPYIDILPKKFDNIPLFFSEQDLDQLQGSMSITKMKDRHESLFDVTYFKRTIFRQTHMYVGRKRFYF